MLDRNRQSLTYGCFDRSYWHYKTLIDFPSATYQQGVLTLALIFKNDFLGNGYYQNKKIIEYAKAGMLFWKKIQNKDGSFNEWYPGEHSYVATAFTSYAISESYLLIEEQIENEFERNEIILALIKAGRWLSNNRDHLVSNHTAGAIAALYNIYLISKDEIFKKAIQNNISILLNNQSPEGWFNEYSGADIGYLSVSIDFLAKYYQKSKDETIGEALAKALEFIKYFIHPDGTSGGEYGSRGTKYLFPHGLVILAKEFDVAGYILSKLKDQKIINPYYLDDRYFIFFFLGNYLQAGIEEREGYEYRRSFQNLNFLQVFPEAGLVSKKNQRYHIICNYKKGGVIKIFTVDSERNKLVYSDAGYFGKINHNLLISSQWLNPEFLGKVLHSDSETVSIELNQQFHYVRQDLPLVKLFIPFRIFNYTFGKVGFISFLFSRWIKQQMIIKKKMAPVFLKRKILLEEKKIIIEDKISSSRRFIFKNFYILNDIFCLHVPSSNYFVYSDLIEQPANKLDFSDYLNRSKTFSIITEIQFRGGEPLITSKINDRIMENIYK